MTKKKFELEMAVMEGSATVFMIFDSKPKYSQKETQFENKHDSKTLKPLPYKSKCSIYQ